MSESQNLKTIAFSADTMEVAQRIIKRYPNGRQKSALLPLLHLAQAEFDGWLSPETMDYIASLLSIKPIEVYEVASFYSMFNLKPVGKCLIEVCRTSSCWMNGADGIIAHISKKLNINVGETTPDGMFTLKAVECLGSCGTAPMMMIGAQFHENLTTEKVDHILTTCQTEGSRKTYLDDVIIDKY